MGIERFLVHQIASELRSNSDKYHFGDIDYDEMSARNRNLWDRAIEAGVSNDVARIVSKR